jgi:hypothetical protein
MIDCDIELDTLLTALYVEIDDLVVPARRGRGRRPRLSDAELLTLAAAQVPLGIDTEARWIRGGSRLRRRIAELAAEHTGQSVEQITDSAGTAGSPRPRRWPTAWPTR